MGGIKINKARRISGRCCLISATTAQLISLKCSVFCNACVLNGVNIWRILPLVFMTISVLLFTNLNCGESIDDFIFLKRVIFLKNS